MSIQAMTWALNQRAIRSSAPRHVLLVLANYANCDGEDAFPSVNRLSQETGMSERTVQRALRELVAAGLIARGDSRIVEAKGYCKNRIPTLYRLNMTPQEPVRGDMVTPQEPVRGDMVTPQEPVRGDMVTPQEPVRGDMVTPQEPVRGDIDDILGCHCDTQTVIEPSIASSSPAREPAHTREASAAAAAAEEVDPKKSEPDHTAQIEDAWRPLALRCEQIAGLDRPGRFSGTAVLGVVRQWIVDAVKMGLSPEEADRLIVEVVERVSGRPNFSCHSLGYFSQPMAKALREAQEQKKFEALKPPADEFEITEEERLAYLAYSRGWRSYDPDAVIEPWRTWIQNRRLAHVAA